ncbi:MAG: hypothetical protein AMK75_06645 [Planctomycetes bacterium SM23_65]|nr:MAG: hypothetical protein AMK75_06645 [Planctomycetes bacterium SM23_65]
MPVRTVMVSVVFCSAFVGFLCGQEIPADGISFDPPTLHCIGVRWFVKEAEHPEAKLDVSYRRKDGIAWKSAMPLRWVETAALQERKPPEGTSLYAGSIFNLTPDTAYDVRLKLRDKTGREVVRTRTMRTWKEPFPPVPKRTLHVHPPVSSGGSTPYVPIFGIASADKQALPGDLILVHKGVYKGPITLTRSGTATAPIVWRAAGDGEVIIEAPADKPGLVANEREYLFFEGLTFRNAHWALVLHNASHVTVRQCRFLNVSCGVTADYDQERLFIADCVFVGPRTWPPDKTRKVEDRGVQLSGVGHVVAYNRISGFRDGVDTRPRLPVRGIDIHNNEISECTDDGIELDYSESNCRAYCNRITNVPLGISFQPSRGGPNYAVRNVLLNVGHESFKLHLTPVKPGHMTSGGVILHNTVVKKGPPFRVWSNEGPARYFYARNNLYVTRDASGAIEITCPMDHADFDYNLYAADKPFRRFAAWNRKRYDTIEDFRKATGQERHGLVLTGIEGILATGVRPPADKNEKMSISKNDFRLAVGSPAIDKGEVLPNINDDFLGLAPDIGAFELGAPLPHYGPRAP